MNKPNESIPPDISTLQGKPDAEIAQEIAQREADEPSDATPVETDELGRPKPDPKCYLKDGDWWYKGAPWGYDDTGCPPGCPNCEREKIKAAAVLKFTADVRGRLAPYLEGNPDNELHEFAQEVDKLLEGDNHG